MILLVRQLLILSLIIPVISLAETGFLRYPDVRNEMAVFTSEGDLWTVGLDGGEATRLTRDDGIEQYARISPDGDWIAFSGDYDGNRDVFVIPFHGGEPKRLTYNPAYDEVIGWTSDSKSVLFRSHRNTPNFTWKIYAVDHEGGLPRDIGLDKGTRISFESGGDRFAYNRIRREQRSWKRYRGGLAMDIWVGNLKTMEFSNITDYDGTDGFPMWIEERIYFLSDRSGRANLFSMLPDGSDVEQHTFEETWDVRWPAGDGQNIIFQKAMDLWVYNVTSGQQSKLDIDLPSDRFRVRERLIDPSDYTDHVSISNSGKRLAVTARGDLFTFPVEEKGYIRQLTHSSEARERWGAFSPDGKLIAYMSDKSGEDEIWVVPSDASSEPHQLTEGGDRFRYPMQWSPDGKMLAFTDKSRQLWTVDAETGQQKLIDKAPALWNYEWSPDSKWLAYVKGEYSELKDVWLYNLDTKQKTRVSSELTDEHNVSWDPEGKYLYFSSSSHFNPDLDAIDFAYIFRDAVKFYVVMLDSEAENPFAPKLVEAFDDEDDEKDKKKGKGKKKDKDKDEDEDDEDDEEEPVEVKIDLVGLQERIYEVPIDAGSYFSLTAVEGRLYYGSWERKGTRSEGERPKGWHLNTFDIEEEEVETVANDARGYFTSPNKKKLVVVKGKNKYFVLKAGATEIPEKKEPVDMSGWNMEIDPPAEWAQTLREVWRAQRDFFYDPNMHGVDWNAVWDQYSALLPRVSNRDELNDLLMEMLGELNIGHAYIGGGDIRRARNIQVGGIGADLEPTLSGAYRIVKILRGDPWADVPDSPLSAPLANAKVGEYIVAIDGIALEPGEEIHKHFWGRAGQQVLLSINDKPRLKGARDVLVKTLKNEGRLRYHDWVRDRREYVDRISGGKIGYVHLPDMGMRGLSMWGRMYLAQFHKDAIIIDVRYNRGGFVADLILARLQNKVWAQSISRDGDRGRRFHSAFYGPMVTVCNHECGSDGETFSEGFKRLGLGELIGTRTWGGWVGIYGWRPLVDRGFNTVPQASGWGAFDGQWLIEGTGVYPTIQVEDEPAAMLRDEDPQLDAAIEHLNEKLKDWPKLADQPPFPKKPLEIKHLR